MVGEKGKPNYPKGHRTSKEVTTEHVNNGPNPSILTERGQAKKRDKEENK